MKYNEFSEICKQKGIKVKDVLVRVGYSRPGLESALNNETIELRKLKLLCDVIRISPAQFFETGTFGVLINNPTTITTNKKTEDFEKEIELLKSQIQDKNEIIALYREKNAGYGIVAEPTGYKTKLTSKD